jgi:acyl-CoA synthetase (AMP-forming)/AMP-acid ligase II
LLAEIESDLATPLTLAQGLQVRAVQDPMGEALLHLKDGEIEMGHLTWAELDAAAWDVAAALGERTRGERALLLYRAGLEFIAAFMGCLYAGILPVAAPADMLGHRGRSLAQLLATLNDAKPAVLLSTGELLGNIGALTSQAPDLGRIAQLDTTAIASGSGARWRPPAVGLDDDAYLQYSSGSTAAPKGVVVGQRELVTMMEMISQAYGYDGDSRFVCWMPHYHDYGLVQGLLHPIYAGIPCVIMSPASFIQRPYRWLAAMTKYRATHSAGPNFAYDHCLRRITEADLATLDLSAWRFAGNGAEPVRAKTLADFAARFGRCGFRAGSFYPSYGLAEATLLVSGPKPVAEALPKIRTLRGAALEHGRVEFAAEDEAGLRHFPSCGLPVKGAKLQIVDPETRRVEPAGAVGEIWVSHGALGRGYWQRPEASRELFRAQIEDSQEGPFLRTGDLGFMAEGEVYIVGRKKDLIIANGGNHHPEEIEWSVEQSHPLIRAGCVAAFTIDNDEGSTLVVLAELASPRAPDTAEQSAALRAIRKAVALDHGLTIGRLALLPPGAIAKTTSGKIQRAACRTALLEGKLAITAEG